MECTSFGDENSSVIDLEPMEHSNTEIRKTMILLSPESREKGKVVALAESQIKPDLPTTKEKYPCPLCTKEFQNKSGRYNHIKLHHKVKLDFGKVLCLEKGCLFSCTYTTVLQKHLSAVHNIPMKYLNLEFDNYEEFEKWKHNFETGEVCRFVKKSGSRVGDAGKSMYLYCSRSGTFVSQGNGRRLKKLGTSKISAHCTALIKYFEESCGKVKATVCTTHYGHDKDHRFLRLTNLQKKQIADKMKSGMSRELVLDSLRSTFVNKLDRIHELCKKDLTNIQKAYKIPTNTERRRSRTAAGSAALFPASLIQDDWIADVNVNVDSPVLYYKEQNCEKETLQPNDKCLILMTKGQKDLFVKFCNNGVLYVTILKLSQIVPLHLTVVFVLDDFYETFPVCFMISNDVRSQVLKICFNEILSAIGPIALRAFATDDQAFVHEAWCDVMGFIPNHVIANRHVDTEWRRNLTVVENEALQGEIYDKLYDFIEGCDGTEDKMISLIAELRTTIVAHSFASYLEKNYLKNIRLWSTCYLKEEYSLREPVDFETSYSKISSLCDVCCKYNKPVGYTAKGLIKLLLDFQSNRNRKVAENVIEIDGAHNLSAECKIENVFPLTSGVWKVNVGENENDFYQVTVDQCNFDDCVLTCARCEACVHNFRCVCENYVDGNTCVHVHLVGAMLKNIKTDTTNVEDGNQVVSKFEDTVESAEHESDFNLAGVQSKELRSVKSETLKILNDIGKKLLDVNDENRLNRLNVLIKDVQGNVDVLLNYGDHAKNVEFSQTSKPIKKKSAPKSVIKKRRLRTRRPALKN